MGTVKEVFCMECDRELREDEDQLCRFCLGKDIAVDVAMRRNYGQRLAEGYRMIQQNG
jgi:hypothetical protein